MNLFNNTLKLQTSFTSLSAFDGTGRAFCTNVIQFEAKHKKLKQTAKSQEETPRIH